MSYAKLQRLYITARLLAYFPHRILLLGVTQRDKRYCLQRQFHQQESLLLGFVKNHHRLDKKSHRFIFRIQNNIVHLSTNTLTMMSNIENPDTPRASEPMLEYGRTYATNTPLHHPTPSEMAVLRASEADIKAGRLYTQEEVDKMVEEWLS